MYGNDLSTVLSWGSNENNSHVMRIWVTMQEDVKPKELDMAVQMSIKRFPYFATQLTLSEDKKHLIVVPNDRPIVVRKGTTPFVLYTEDSNYHSQGICFDGKKIIFDTSHGTCDGKGYYRFMRTTLYFYITYVTGKELNTDGVWLPGDPFRDDELTDPFGKLLLDETVTEKTDQFQGKIMALRQADSANKKIYYKIKIPSAEFVKLSKKYGSSPAAMIPAYFCRTILDLHDDMKGSVISGDISADTRDALNCPNAYHSVSVPVRVVYSEEQRKWTVGEIAKYSRSMIKNYVYSEEFLANTKATVKLYHQISQMKLSSAMRCAKALLYHHINEKTFLTSYPGKLNWGELETYIEDAGCLALVPPAGISLMLQDMNGNLYGSFCQAFDDDRYVKKFVELLKKDGIDCECSEALPFEVPILDYKKAMK